MTHAPAAKRFATLVLIVGGAALVADANAQWVRFVDETASRLVGILVDRTAQYASASNYPRDASPAGCLPQTVGACR